MLPARAAPEISTCAYKDFGLVERLSVENKIGVCPGHRVFAKSMEQGMLEAGPFDGLQELLGDDHISVHVFNG